MKKRLVSMVLILGMLIQFGGCSGMDLIGKEKLNERQKKILVENGLSADWKDLKYDQKESITAIEEMLEYLEEKYGKEFEYLGYDNGLSFGDDEDLIAVAVDDDPVYDGVSVWRDEEDKTKFHDDYATVKLKKKLREESEPFLNEVFDGADYMIYIDALEANDNGDKLEWGDVEIHVRASQMENVDSKEAYNKLWDYYETQMDDLRGVFLYVVKDEKFDEEYQIGYPEFFGEGDTVEDYVSKSDTEE
ncbi:MAG: hypothetical protein IJJ59_06795 [Pseudobutyrivibrio sp.]|uniref:hypothetical protein n=1 Tax=Pseudobutyrivibrio sp. TaxID=2014367 RepID=UPI0025DB3821|nr:hypothetical protein [Pseudobutyrivibrio sp.]MBQ6463012.1 hypothetical protein [Pseudobutyrivibrio sp.]